MAASTNGHARKLPNYHILFFVPNIVGYARVILLAASWLYMETVPEIFLTLYITSVILDAVDGIVARCLNQTSAFGAWFDIVIDNFGRGMLWSYLYKWGYLVGTFEWLVFVCTHTYGPAWKTAGLDTPPFWVKAVMAHNFRTVVGCYAIAGLHFLPIWIYSFRHLKVISEVIGSHVITCITVLLVSGRLACVTVESWFIWIHVKGLLTNFDDSQDEKEKFL